MKAGIHPQTNPCIFVDTSSGVEFFATSTRPGDSTREVDGVTYQVIEIEISSASHPFYTGKQIFVDTARRVEKFQEKMERVEKAAANRKGKKAKRAARAATKTDEPATAPQAQTDETTQEDVSADSSK